VKYVLFFRLQNSRVGELVHNSVRLYLQIIKLLHFNSFLEEYRRMRDKIMTGDQIIMSLYGSGVLNKRLIISKCSQNKLKSLKIISNHFQSIT